MNYRDLLYFDGPNTLEEVTRQRDILAEAIAEAAHKCGHYNAEAPISGPHLLMFLDEMAAHINGDLMGQMIEISGRTDTHLEDYVSEIFEAKNVGFFGSFKPFAPSVGFEHLQPNIQGIWVDGEWKRAMEIAHPATFAAAEQGREYDGSRFIALDCGSEFELCDVKFLTKIKKTSYKTSADVYISHNEYKFGRMRNIVYEIVFLEDGLIQHLTSFTFSEAKEKGAITLYPEGRWVKDNETGKDAAPWCIDVLTVRPELVGRLQAAYEGK